jgi:succinate dehydrogenase/fumarate reductase cytochrome b subunit
MGCLTAAGVDVGALATTLGQSGVAPLFKFGVAFPLVYHYLGGIRHMLWDKAPDSLTNEDVHNSSLMLIGSSAVLSLGFTAL